MLNRGGINPSDLLRHHVSGDFGKAGHYNDILLTLTQEELELQALATSDDGKLTAIAVKTGTAQAQANPAYC